MDALDHTGRLQILISCFVLSSLHPDLLDRTWTTDLDVLFTHHGEHRLQGRP
jgi:hypothetical protein